MAKSGAILCLVCPFFFSVAPFPPHKKKGQCVYESICHVFFGVAVFVKGFQPAYSRIGFPVRFLPPPLET